MSGKGMHNQGGFTLVECILSIIITSLILGALYGCYAAGLQSWHQGMSRADLYQNGRAALDIMSRDLEAAFLSPNDFGTRFVGEDFQDPETGADMDRLTFIAVNHEPYLGMTGQSDLTEISYFIDTDPKTPERWLQRRVDATPDRDPFSGGGVSLLGIRVVALDLRYLGGQDKWAYMWDSKRAIPRAVRITLTVEPDPRLARQNQRMLDDYLTLTTTVWLRQWYPVRRTEEGGTETNRASRTRERGGRESAAPANTNNERGGNRSNANANTNARSRNTDSNRSSASSNDNSSRRSPSGNNSNGSNRPGGRRSGGNR